MELYIMFCTKKAIIFANLIYLSCVDIEHAYQVLCHYLWRKNSVCETSLNYSYVSIFFIT